jgi:hypothetical protein
MQLTREASNQFSAMPNHAMPYFVQMPAITLHLPDELAHLRQ